MPEVTAGLYQVIFEQSFQTQIVINRHWYQHTLDLDDEQELLANAFDDDVVAAYSGAQSSSLLYESIRVVNVTGDLADFIMSPTIVGGSNDGEPLPSINAAGIKLLRTTKETRNGQKRVAGGREDDQNNGTWSAPYLALLDTLGDALVGQVSQPGGIFDPVIGRIDLGPPVVYTINTIAGHLINDDVTSQVSRKKKN